MHEAPKKVTMQFVMGPALSTLFLNRNRQKLGEPDHSWYVQAVLTTPALHQRSLRDFIKAS